MEHSRLASQIETALNGHQFGRRYRMTFVIGCETIIFALLMMTIPQIHHWAAIVMLSTGIILSIINMLALKRYHCVNFSSTFLTLLIFFTVASVNYISGGIETSLFIWFYIVPLVAATLNGFMGLIIFGGLCILAITAFLFFPHEPLFHPPESLIWYVQLINFVFAMLLTLSVLIAFLAEIHDFEQRNLKQQQALEDDREKLLHMSRHDMLTKLPNRQYFNEELEKRVRSKQKFTILYMDLNGFKHINDHYGHDAGDRVLTETSKRLSNCFRDDDFISRVGGDEFIGIASNGNHDISQKIMARIRHVFTFPFRSLEDNIELQMAIGFANYPKDSSDIEKLLAIADHRMYDDKARIKAMQNFDEDHS